MHNLTHRPVRHRNLRAILVGCLCASFLLPQAGQAVAFRMPNQDPEAIARGNAFAATADNPSAIYYNPAGITQLHGHHLRLGAYLVSADTRFESTSGATARTGSEFQPVPQLYYVLSPEESRLSFGMGLYAPYGLSLDWGKGSPLSTLAESGKLLYATFNPVVAWEIHPTLSIGAGPTINYAEAKLSRAIGLMPGDVFKFTGDGLDYGFNAGLLWKPHEQWAFGLNYRYLTTIEFQGESEAKPYAARTASSAEVRFPQFAVAGVSYRPTPDWNLEVNLDWTDWDNVNQIMFEGTSFGSVPFILNYRSSFMYEFGVTRKFANGYFVSGGYFFSENSSPDRNFNPIVPDGDLHLGSIGVGRRGVQWDWAVAYHFATNGGGREVRGSTPGGLADGTYKTFNQAVNFALTFKF